MNPIDFGIAAIILFFGVKGLIRGLFIEVLTLVGLILAFIVSVREVSLASSLIQKIWEMPVWLSSTIGYTIIFTVIVLLSRWLALLLHKLFKKTPVVILDRAGGAIFGSAKGLLIASIAAFVVGVMPLQGKVAQIRNTSVLFAPVSKVAPVLFDVCKTTLPQTDTFYNEIRQAIDAQSKAIKDKLIQDQLDKLDKVKGFYQSPLDGDIPEEFKEKIDRAAD